MARHLITGGEGFIGRHLAASLLAAGDEVVVLGRPKPTSASVLEGAESVRIDLADPEALAELFARERFETIFHLAAQTRRGPGQDLPEWRASLLEDVAPLVGLVTAAAEAPAPPRVLVRAGSIAEYGRALVPYREAARCLPVTPYGTALLAGTNYLEAMAPHLPFAVANARLALTYGPGQSPAFLAARLLRDLPQGRPVTIARPEDRRDLIHVDDVVAGLLRLSEQAVPIVNLCTGKAPSMRTLAECVLRQSGADPALVHYASQLGTPCELRSSPVLSRVLLDFRARIGLEDGIAASLAAHSTFPEDDVHAHR